MSKEQYDMIKEILAADEKIMPDDIRFAWYGYIQALYKCDRLSFEESEELGNMLNIDSEKQTDIYDALAGGISDLSKSE